jgi:hypothetical protein
MVGQGKSAASVQVTVIKSQGDRFIAGDNLYCLSCRLAVLVEAGCFGEGRLIGPAATHTGNSMSNTHVV